MFIERYKNTTVPDWYMARLKFKTKYGTIAQASGYGRSFSEAIVDCFRDYKLINSL